MSQHRGKNPRSDWQTPDDLLEAVRSVGPIMFDPATSRNNPLGAERIRTADCDPNGLETNWGEFRGMVFVNPPYTAPWYRKIESELRVFDSRLELLALLPAKPGTKWFQDIAVLCDQVCFIRGRIKFNGAQNPAPFDSALLYRGPRIDRFRLAFRKWGWLIPEEVIYQ